MQKTPAAGRGKSTLVFFVVFLLGCITSYWGFFKPLTLGIASRRWMTVPCRVISSEVKSHSSGDGGPTYSVEISYAYWVDGQEYRSDRYQFLRISSSGRAKKANIVARYPRGANITCFVNPKNPAEAVLDRDISSVAWFGLIPLAFLAVGLGGVIVTLRSRKNPSVDELARNGNSNNITNQPWLQRADWATGRVISSSKKMMLIVWAFAGAWNLISTPITGAVLSDHAIQRGNYGAALVLIFPLVGLGLLFWAGKITLRWLKFGESVFEMACVPGIIGGALVGAIRPSHPIRPEGPVELRLNCIARTAHRGGDGDSTSERILWQHEENVEIDPSGAIPVAFYIPADGRETNTFGSGDGTLWRLEAKARVQGVDYAAQFEVPVFQVEQTPEQQAEAQKILAREQAEVAAYVPPQTSRIRVQMALRGGMEFYFPAFRNAGPAAFLMVFLTIWTGSIYFMITHHAPILFPIVFGFFELLILLMLGSLMFGTTRVEVGPEGIAVTSGFLGIGRTKTVAAPDVFDIKTKIGMNSGNSVYHDIKIVLHNGKEIGAGSSIKNAREAEWLASEMLKALLGKPTPRP